MRSWKAKRIDEKVQRLYLYHSFFLRLHQFSCIKKRFA